MLRALLGADVSTLAKPTAAGDLPLHLALDSTLNHSVAAGAAPYHYPNADFAAAANCLAMAYPPAATVQGSRTRRPFELAVECGADETLQEMLFAMADVGTEAEQSMQQSSRLPALGSQRDLAQGGGATPRGNAVPAYGASPEHLQAQDEDSFEAREAAEMRRLSAAIRMAEARVEGLKVDVAAWRAEAAAREHEIMQGSAAAKARAEKEVAEAGAKVAALRAGAEQLAAAVETMTETLDEREDEIEQLEEALEWQEDLIT